MEQLCSVNWTQTVLFGKYQLTQLSKSDNVHPPYRRYCFHKLPFGISSAPEYFQRCMSDILEVLCHIDDVIIFGRNKQEHDEQLYRALKSIQAAGVTLNREKCKFNKE